MDTLGCPRRRQAASNAQRDIQQKQQVLARAEGIGNVRKTRRHFGIPRTLFYVWRGGYQREGVAGLMRKRPCVKSHSKTTTLPEVVKQILHLRRTYHLGPIRIVWHMARYPGITISEATVCILRRYGMHRLPNRGPSRRTHPSLRQTGPRPPHPSGRHVSNAARVSGTAHPVLPAHGGR